jgi:uncharacterized protein YjbJ (UPF0337 family)
MRGPPLVNEVRGCGQQSLRRSAGARCRFRPAVSAEDALSFLNKIRNKSQVIRGRGKQKVGRATNNRRLQAEGLADRIGGSTRQLGEKLKDAGKDAKRRLKR